MTKIISWVLSFFVPYFLVFLIGLVFDLFVSIGFAGIVFVAFDILIGDIFTIVDSMLSGLIPLNSKQIVEAAGLFLALKIYLGAMGTRFTIFAYFKAWSFLSKKNKPVLPTSK